MFESEPWMPVVDPIGIIRHKLYFEHSSLDTENWYKMKYVKNLDRLRRDLNRVIVIDYRNPSEMYFDKHFNNVLKVKQYDGESIESTISDTIIPLIDRINRYNVYDTREIIKGLNSGKSMKEVFSEYEQRDNAARAALRKQKNQFVIKSNQTSQSDNQVDKQSWIQSIIGLFSSKKTQSVTANVIFDDN